MNPVVIKVGGALLDSPEIASHLLAGIAELMPLRQVILVHGGGPLVETVLAGMGLTSTKIDGLRVSPDDHMPYVCGALAGSANKTLCALAVANHITPVGISLLDGDIVKCELFNEKYGAVGVPQGHNPALLNALYASNMLPIISSIGCNQAGRLLNINADQAATAVAQLVQGDLLLLSNVPGVLDADKQLIAQLDNNSTEFYAQTGVITDGMLVKVKAALLAATTLQRPVTIASWSTPLTDILANKGGTRVFHEPVISGEQA
jgi:acetylglutamate kinase